MSEKEERELNIKDFKYSFNEYHKIYRVEIFQHGKWGDCKYGIDTFKNIINLKLNTRENLRNKKHIPYLYFVIKWRLMFIRDFFNKESTRKEMKFWGGILTPIIATFIALLSVFDNRINRKESIEILEKNITKNKDLTKAKHKVLEGKIFLLTQKIDSVHLDHLENIRVLEKKIEKKKKNE
jgi:hypothetical protein